MLFRSTFLSNLNPNSLVVLRGAKLEPSLKDAPGGYRCQFERHGYFFADPADTKPGSLVFNRSVTLKDSWSKVDKGPKPKASSPGGTRGG